MCVCSKSCVAITSWAHTLVQLLKSPMAFSSGTPSVSPYSSSFTALLFVKDGGSNPLGKIHFTIDRCYSEFLVKSSETGQMSKT